MEIELAARDTSGPVLDKFGSTVKRTFEQASQDAAQASKGASLLDRTFGNLADTVRAVGLAFGAYEAARYAQQAVMLAARYETLGVTLQQLGKTAGYNKAFLDQQEESLRKAGITAIGSREALARMIQANLDLSKSAQLARVAQDAAAISGVNSSEAYQKIVYGIQSAQVEMLRTVGINVSFENSYAAVARQTGRTAESLTEAEKAQIRLNAVLEAGKGISGAYEAAMGTAGKQILSFQRYAEDLQVELGKAFGPALSEIVAYASARMHDFTEAVKSPISQGALSAVASGLVQVVTHLDVLASALAVGAAAWIAYKVETTAASVAASATSMGFTVLERGIFGLYQGIYNVLPKVQALWALLAAHPYTIAVAALGALVTGHFALTESTSEAIKKTENLERQALDASKAYQASSVQARDLTSALDQLNRGLADAGRGQGSQIQTVTDLTKTYPILSQAYQDVGGNVEQFRLKVESLVAAQRAEAELDKQKALDKQREAYARIVDILEKVQHLTLQTAASTLNAMHGIEDLGEEVGIAGLSIKEANAYALMWIKNLAVLEKMKGLPGLDPKIRDQYSEAQNSIFLLLQQLEASGKVADAVKEKIEKFFAAFAYGAQNAQSSLAQINIGKLSPGESKALAEIEKYQREAQTFSLHPLQAKLAEINQAEKEATTNLLNNTSADSPVGFITDMGQVGLETIKHWGEAQRAALAPELAKTQAEWARGYHEIGATTREQLLANLEAEAGVLAAGGDRTRSQYLQTQKAITDLTLQGFRDRQAITEASFNLGREGQGALIAAYQAELAILPALKMSAEDRARRELELTTKIRDVKEQGFTRELDLEKQRVSWMADGTAKHKAQLDLQEAEERHHLEVLFAANQDLQNKKKQILDDYEKFAQRRREESASKERQQALDVQLQTAKLYGNTRLAKELELAKYAESLKTSGINQIYHEQLIANERVRINRTGVESMLLLWGDFYEGWDKIGENFLQNVQSDISGAFKSAFEGTTTLWEGMWASMKNISYQAMAAISTRLLTYGIGQLAISIMPGLAGPLGMSGGGGGLGSLLSLASGAKSAYGLFSGPGLSTFGEYGGFGSGMFTWGGGTGFENLPMATGLSGMGYATAGIGGGLTGWQIAQMLYGSGTGSQVGGALGGAAGGIGGAMVGTMILPGIGTAIGGLLGGLLGGAGGGGLGSLFDDEDDTPNFAKAGPQYAEAHWKELSDRLDGYLQKAKEGKLTQAEFNEEFAKMAPLAAGAYDYLGGYGAIIGGTIESLSQLTAGTQEYADKVATELNPAWIIATGLAQNLADGMDKLDAHKKALSDAIDALAASSGLSADQQSQLVDLVIKQSGSVAELTEKYNRYNEIKRLLTESHGMERGQVEALGAELRALHDELGIAANPMDNLTKVTGSLDKTMQSLEKTMRAIFNLPSDKEFNITTNYSTNGSPAATAHTGSLVSAALAHGYITRHGGGPAPFYAHAGNPAWDPPKPGEVDIRALMGEWVIQPAAVDFYGNDFMSAINDMRVPVKTGASGGAVPLAAAGGPPVIQPYFDFRGASFGSDPQETAQLIGDAVDDRLRALMADMDYRGENPAVSHSMAVSQ